MARLSLQARLMLTAVPLIVLGSAQMAMAHAGPAPGQSPWLAGAIHPITGADHLLAILCSGLLAFRVGTKKALWMVPLAFVGLMLVGGALALLGVPMPHAEWGISMSVIVLAMLVAFLPSVPLWLAASLVGLFAVFHGHAHAAEMMGAAVAPFLSGMVVTTIILHAIAIGFGLKVSRITHEGDPRLVRFAGGAIAALFLGILVIG